MAIKRKTVHPVVGTVEWETSKLESGNAIKLLNNFEKNIGLVLVPQLEGINDVRTDALQNAGSEVQRQAQILQTGTRATPGRVCQK